MTHKMTQDKSDALDVAIGAIPIGPYINSSTKRLYKCTMCGDLYNIAPSVMRYHKQTNCKKCGAKKISQSKQQSQEHADDLDKMIGAIPIGVYNGNHTKREYKCIICGSSYFAIPNMVRTQKVTNCPSCGIKRRSNVKRHTINHIKQILKRLGFQLLSQTYEGSDSPLTLLCYCGNVFNSAFHSIQSGHTKSCGHCNDPKIGDKFGRLTVIMVFPQKIGGGCNVVCECECGRDTKILKGFTLTGKRNLSCGNCILNRNGRATSYTALKLHDLIEKITNQKWEHNYHIKTVGCVDIANVKDKIVVEYNGYYNHMIRSGNSTIKDKTRIKKLLKLGWKVLTIKAGGYDIPTANSLKTILCNHFEHKCKQKTITLKSWYKAKEKHQCV